jgi:DNA topoisomerase-1
MPKHLLVVESPAKARTIRKFLGNDFVVEACMGHVRDLPERELAVDVERDFRPTYVIPKEKQATVKRLRESLRKCSDLWVATDEDREGEAIGWHLTKVLNIVEPETVKRIVFHEITREAIELAAKHPRTIDIQRVQAQQARRVLDRLVGYTLSPLLWKKIYSGLSAGRVQSVAVRLIVERERVIQAFVPEEYWSITAHLENTSGESFDAELKSRITEGEKARAFVPKNEGEAKGVLASCANKPFTVVRVESKDIQKSPPPPFTTSSLQQEGSRKLGFSVKQTMFVAQQLYEGVNLGKGEGQTGLITYMRTDSVTLSQKALNDCRDTIQKLYGREYILSSPRRYRVKSKTSQEAHEAIRPTELQRTPESLAHALDEQQMKLYRLIWERTMATQMPTASFHRIGADISCNSYLFRATGQTVTFDGYLRVYREDAEGDDEGEKVLPPLKEKENLRCNGISPAQHFTKPPPRYTEASLVKKLEEEGIGRPSTYAPTISTIQQRGYVLKDGRNLRPQEVAMLVTDLLTTHFPNIVDLAFTAKMEQSLDDIAEGKLAWVPFLRSFYDPFSKVVQEKSKIITKGDIVKDETSEVCDACGQPMQVKMSRYGRFLACSSFPKCRFKKPLPEDRERIESREREREELERKLQPGSCPECRSSLKVRQGRYGPFLGCSSFPKCTHVQNIMQSLGLSCPECSEGEIVQRQTRRRRRFWGCSRYPACTYATWKDPTKGEQGKQEKQEKQWKQKSVA